MHTTVHQQALPLSSRAKVSLAASALACAGVLAPLGSHAQMAQEPLLSRVSNVPPNVVFMFDDSGSMAVDFSYQYGPTTGGYGNCGPNGSMSGGLCNTLPDVVRFSPDVNLIHYDPRVRYERRVNVDGSSMAAGSTAAHTSFQVYFHKQPPFTSYKVGSVAVTAQGSGYPSSGVVPSFSLSAGGTTALGKVIMGTSQGVGSVSISDGGRNYPSSGGTVTFSAPSGPGGVTATGTLALQTGNSVNTVSVTNSGTGYPNSVTATFSAPAAGGVQAVPGTVTLVDRYAVASISLVNPGLYRGAPTVSLATTPANNFISGGSAATGLTAVLPTTISQLVITNQGNGYANGTRTLTCSGGAIPATGTATISGGKVTSVTLLTPGSGFGAADPGACSMSGGGGSTTATIRPMRPVSSVTFSTPGVGYISVPTVTFSAGPTGGVTATGTVTPSVTKGISAIAVTEPGFLYNTAPTITLSAAGTVSAAFTVNLTSNRRVTGVNFTSVGSGYTSAPTVTFAGGAPNAVGTATLASTNVITGFSIENSGSGYNSTPTITLSGTGSGSGAAFAVSMVADSVSSGEINARWNGITTPPSTLTHFYNPSYTPNPATDLNSALASGASALPYPNTASAGTSLYPKFVSRTDCTQNVGSCTWSEEVQNYANWHTYHRTRIDLAKTGIGLAYQPLNPNFRLGWGTIGQLGGNSPTLASGVRLYNDTVKSEFFTWLYARGTPSSTPNRKTLDQVGKYYMRKDDNGPWGDSPNGDAAITSSAAANPGHASCRRSYAMLMTDGYYNDSTAATGLSGDGDVDSTEKTVTNTGGTYIYPGNVGPYSDHKDGTKFFYSLADVAMKYWATDLRDDVPNGIKPITEGAGDPAFWQHLNFYAIGLGVFGTLNNQDPAVLAALTGTNTSTPPRTLNWPQPLPSNPTSIDDMWHATLNGRGRMLNAKTSADLKTAVTSLMNDIETKVNSEAGVAVSTANLKAGTKKYTPEYTSGTWVGNVRATFLNASSGDEGFKAWEVETPVPGQKDTYVSLIPAAATRNILVGNGATSGVRAEPFTWADMSAANKALLSATATEKLMNYLRGDKTDEDTSKLVGSALYRHRPARLGDIVNSTPVFVKDTVDLEYEKLPSTVLGQSTYRAYVDGVSGVGGKKQRTEGMLFTGANDGMLHAFRDGVYTDTSGSAESVVTPGGVEQFAYIPRALLPSLAKLADKAYTHRYYVDGPLTETDAYFTAGTPRWANVVIGSTGGGAGVDAVSGTSPRTAVFAIDVTSISSGVNTLNANSVLWEIGSHNGDGPVSDFAELGHILTEVQAGPTLGGQWVAIFGNGYQSKSCQASLFVVNLETGARIREIKTNVGACTASGANGLGGVHIVRNANQQIIGVYAGDLQGNLWKFNLNESDPNNWKLDLDGLPLLAGAYTQPITGAPSTIKLTAATTPNTGYMVVFGTGKFFETADLASVHQQYVYGVWDPLPFGAPSIPAGTALAANSSLLVAQGVLTTEVIDGNEYYTTSANAVDYGATPAMRGWKFTQPRSGERLIYPIPVIDGNFIIAETVSPENTSIDLCTGTASGIGFKYIFNGLTGASPGDPIFDTNSDGVIDSADAVVSGYKTSADGRDVTLLVNRSATGTKYVLLGAETRSKVLEISCKLRGDCANVTPTGINSRQWRQIFPR
jgi:type IV pilus assembly protein PilY1